jgi:IS4 transposase
MFDELGEDQVTKVFNAVEELLWEIAEQRGLTDNFVDVAIDGHDWLFYGDSDAPRITSVDPNRGTNKAYEFFTLSVVGDDGEKFVVGVKQVTSRQEQMEAVKDLLEEADDRLFVRDAYLDRGFYGTFFALAMKETGVNFVVRASLGAKSKKMWKNAEEGVNVERATMSRSRAPYLSVEVTRFVVPARDDADAEYMSFITNRNLTKKQARRIGRDYKRRWGIETSYRVINDFLPKTTSKDIGLRVWYYQMGTLLYNVWVLVNSVVAEALGLDKDASPPVTAKYMLTVMISKHGDHSIS